ncbi:MAG: hypothetical protein Q7T54_04610 [Candidatus Levybacteria bacterium]|nr:hypothetical protein [Candidatus Levybacteria bacterium]
MTEIPQQIPLEERVKQDPRFNNILLVNPPFLGTISNLVETSEQNPSNIYPDFWIKYLTIFNAMVARDLGTKNGDLNLAKSIGVTRQTVSSYMNSSLLGAIRASSHPDFFQFHKSPSLLELFDVDLDVLTEVEREDQFKLCFDVVTKINTIAR